MTARYATKDEVLNLASNAFPDDAVLVDLVDTARSMVPLDSWGDSTFAGHWRIVAHYALVLSKSPGGSSGVVTSRSMGQISESYQPGSDEDLCRTEYGRQFMALRKTIANTVSFGDGDRGWTAADGSIR